MELTGKVKKVLPEQQINATYKKRELVITTEEQYPQDILIEFSNAGCDLLTNLKAGQLVKVSINIKGREWINPQGEAKYFNTIQGWKIQ